MKNIVAKNSSNKYDAENVKLLLWLYNDEKLREEILRDSLVDSLNEASPSERDMRKICKIALNAVEKGADNCPILLQKLTFNIFSHYLATRRNRKQKYLSKTSYGSVRSALMHLYRTSGETMDEDYQKSLSQFLSGMKRTVAQAKAESGESLDEGKKPMTFEVYQTMCKLLMQGEGDDYMFAHAFLTLEWNLLARSDNCFQMHINHIEWRDDCMVVFFAKSKGNQTGERTENPWHVYSNPDNPEVCPVLGLAKYLFSNPEVIKNNGKLFPGEHQYDRFIGIFNRVILDNVITFRSLGVVPGSLGSHSCRKGAITLLSSGCTVSPPMSSICLRACWSMGPVKDRYIHYEKAGDQFCGRSATGTSSLLKEFAISPAYFDFTDAPRGSKEMIDKVLEDNLARSDEIRSTLFCLTRFLLASICFHYDFLKENLHCTSKLRGSPLFIAASQLKIRKLAVIRFPWNKTGDTPLFTGIPPHVLLMASIETLKASLKSQQNQIISEMRKELDNRHVGGDSFQASKILEDVTRLLQQISDVIVCSSEPIQSHPFMSAADTDETMFDDFLRIPDEESNEIDAIENEGDTVRQKGGIIISWDNCKDGKLKLLTSTFKFPKLSFQNFVTMWYCGDNSNNIPPFKVLRSCDVKSMKGGANQLSMMRYLMRHVERAAGVVNLPHLIVRKWTPRNSIDLYNAVKHMFAFPNVGGKSNRRHAQMSWKSYYNLLNKRKGILYGEHRSDNGIT